MQVVVSKSICAAGRRWPLLFANELKLSQTTFSGGLRQQTCCAARTRRCL